MNILITYATHSGSTYLVAKYIADSLQSQNHQVTLTNIIETTTHDLTSYDLCLLGSNSWDFEKKEGQPHHAFIQFLESYPTLDLQNHRFAIFGCGDKSYQYFCGALDIISKYISENHGIVLSQPLKINQYYFTDHQQIHHQIDQWLEQVIQATS